MTIFKVRDRREEYRIRARSLDVHELNGRSGRQYLTEFVIGRILTVLRPTGRECIVDIGCGDGRFLREVPVDPEGRLIGVLPSPEEVARLEGDLSEDERRRIDVMLGEAAATGLSAGVADLVVFNGVIINLEDPYVDEALREISRILKPGGTAFIGEMPERSELANVDYGDSITAWLWWVLRKRGPRAFARDAGRTLKCLVTKEPFIIVPKSHWFCDVDEFGTRLLAAGLRTEWRERHQEITIGGEVVVHPTRWDFVCRRDG